MFDRMLPSRVHLADCPTGPLMLVTGIYDRGGVACGRVPPA